MLESDKMAVSKGGPSEPRRWLAAEVMDLISVLNHTDQDEGSVEVDVRHDVTTNIAATTSITTTAAIIFLSFFIHTVPLGRCAILTPHC